MHSPIFLIGTQRSGTTLLTRMLSAHKDIFIKNEALMGEIFKPGSDRKQIEAAIDKSVQTRHGKSIAQLLESEGKSIWGLKDPQLTEHLVAIKQFLPEARFIIIIRDARAVVRSYIENAWGLGTNCYTGALRWDREVRQQLEFENELPDYVHRLRYEDLVVNQKECLEGVCSFIGVPFDESMLNYANAKAFVSKNRQSMNSFKELDPKIISKWKQGLSEHQIKVINTVAGDLLKKLGYSETENCYQKISTSLKYYYRAHQKIIGEIQIQYRWRIGGYKQNLKALFKRKTGET